MAENDLEEESLISQDDIDKLMESPPAGEKEQKLQEDAPGREEDQEEDQEDFSQDDIDALLDGMDFDAKEPESAEDEQDDEDEDDLDLISQDDINRLMNADADEIGESSDSPDTFDSEQAGGEPEEREPEPEMETAPADEEPEPEEEAKESADAEVQEAGTRGNPDSDGAEDDWLIDKAESVDIQESLMTQAGLDELLAGKEEPVAEEEPEETAEDAGPATEAEPEEEMEPVRQEEPYSRQEEDSGATVVDLEDDELDDSLEGEYGEPDTSQEDIDTLLTETDEDEDEDEWGGDDLISQQDIEDLIMESGGEEDDGEDILSDSTPPLDDEDEDFESEPEGSGEDDSENDKIVLEASDTDETDSVEEEEDQSRDGDKTGKRKWYKSRVFVLAASIIIAVGITISAGLFFFLPGEKPKSPAGPSQERVVRKAAPEEEPGVDTVDINLEDAESAAQNEAAAGAQPEPAPLMETIVMRDFVVLAPESVEGLVYVRAALSIDYSGEKAYNSTRNNLPYFRDVVYASIKRAFESGKGDKVTQSELLAVVQEALKRELPSSQIRDISFESFKAG
mgnify:CR=1 FL=1